MFKFEERNLGDGAMEIGVRSMADNQLVAVITRPCKGAKWFIHRMGDFRKESTRSKKSAMQKFMEE